MSDWTFQNKSRTGCRFGKLPFVDSARAKKQNHLGKATMKYLLSIYCDEAADARKSKEERKQEHAAYGVYTSDGRERGVILAGEALHPSSTATTVRVRNGQVLTSDGPFAESKEQVGGYYVVDCENLDEAIEWAQRIPHAAQGAIEIRPAMVFS
jgi:hypothetical protein